MFRRVYFQAKILLSMTAQCFTQNDPKHVIGLYDSDRSQWTVEEVARILERENMCSTAVVFREHKISGKYLDQDTAELMGHLFGDQVQLNELTSFLTKLAPKSCTSVIVDAIPKIVNDPVHGHIVLHPLCVAIIDTPQFQRLRYLQQLGATQFVYPGGSHSRFEHSLGVSHLAGKLVLALQKKQQELNINLSDILCVKIAGLCHDLGHGPFSHLFDEKFICKVRPGSTWKHEDASRDMLDHMFRDPSNKLVTRFRDYGLKKEDYIFIREQICPTPIELKSGQVASSKEWPFMGRSKDKSFLYEIVANKRNGVDVDKWDYLARDCHHLGMHSSFDHTRMIHFARVINVDGEMQICLRDKEAYNVYEMFHTRHCLHRYVYMHRVKNAIDVMLVDALKKINNVIKIPGKDGNLKPLSDCITDMAAYTRLTDNIFHQILYASEEHLTVDEKKSLWEAQQILESVHQRDLYQCLFESPPLAGNTFSDELSARENLMRYLTPEERADLKECFQIELLFLDFGKQEKNPLLDLRFYSKEKPNTAQRLEAQQVSRLVPQEHFREQIVRIFLKHNADDRSRELLKKMVDNFKKEKHDSYK